MPRKTSTSKTKTKAAPFEWPKRPSEVLLDYLRENVTAEPDTPFTGLPYINEKGTLHVNGKHWRAWLKKQKLTPSPGEAGAPLRDAKLIGRAVPVPGTKKSAGFYVGAAPTGTKSLPRRKRASKAAAEAPAAAE